MASKNNYYAVKSGRKPGIYSSWDECKEQINGFKGSEFKGFITLEEAEAYMNMSSNSIQDINAYNTDVTAYVDGSYYADTSIYGFGCVMLTSDSKVFIYGAGNNEESAELRNVAGEMLGSMNAVKYAMKNGFKSICICYDYYGVEMWAIGGWKANTVLTRKYQEWMLNASKYIDISFKKIAAHTGDKYNEEADQLAKKAVKNFKINANKVLTEVKRYDNI